MTNIHDLVNLIREQRKLFQAKIIDANLTRKRELETMKVSYIPESAMYKAEQDRIEKDYTASIVDARRQFTETVTEEIESLKTFEIAKVQRIDQGVMSLLNSLQNIPLSESELKIVMDKHATSNYWAQRAIASLADTNGISQSSLGLQSSIDTKINILGQFIDQLENLIKDFDETAKTPEAGKARFLYLNDDILQNAIEIYTNSKHDESATNAATKAYYQIKATSGDMGRGISISNVLRNLKNEDARNSFLYRLANDSSISSDSFEVAGISDEISDWRHGKSERYLSAIDLAETVSKLQSPADVTEHLQVYSAKNPGENEFLPRELQRASRKHSAVKEALQSMSDTDAKPFTVVQPGE